MLGCFFDIVYPLFFTFEKLNFKISYSYGYNKGLFLLMSYVALDYDFE